ncbi:MAG: hypothetical protein HRU15_16505, partial [Planctomycetes bacterium]|nr:hypothetical protein [Planctomycetota bacterium]
ENILRKLSHNYENFHDSWNAYEVQQQHLTHALEEIRLARLYKKYPLVRTAYRQHNPSMAQAREMYYQTLSESLRQHASLAKHFTRLWRDMGLAQHLPQRLKTVHHNRIQAQRFSTWVWDSKELLSGNKSIHECIRSARSHNVKRLYVYLESDDKVLNDALLSERLTMLINKGASANIDVWALVGHSKLTAQQTQSQITNSARNIEQYNKRFHALEPRIAGMKVHMQQAGSNDLIEQKQYRHILEQTRALLPKEIPLWIDVPMTAFTEENAHHIRDVLDLVNGITVFNPNGNNKQILLQSDTVLELSPTAVEFALQQNPKADGKQLNAIIRRFNKSHLNNHKFAGIALLDWTQVLETAEDTAEDSE